MPSGSSNQIFNHEDTFHCVDLFSLSDDSSTDTLGFKISCLADAAQPLSALRLIPAAGRFTQGQAQSVRPEADATCAWTVLQPQALPLLLPAPIQ